LIFISFFLSSLFLLWFRDQSFVEIVHHKLRVFANVLHSLVKLVHFNENSLLELWSELNCDIPWRTRRFASSELNLAERIEFLIPILELLIQGWLFYVVVQAVIYNPLFEALDDGGRLGNVDSLDLLFWTLNCVFN